MSLTRISCKIQWSVCVSLGAMETIRIFFDHSSTIISYTPSKNPFLSLFYNFFECTCEKTIFLGSLCKNEGVHIQISSRFYIYSIFKTYTPSISWKTCYIFRVHVILTRICLQSSYKVMTTPSNIIFCLWLCVILSPNLEVYVKIAEHMKILWSVLSNTVSLWDKSWEVIVFQFVY